jgi:AcrR family transcriptional regulator
MATKTAVAKKSVKGQEGPRSARGLRTRAALVRAARSVFERDGYLDAHIADITAEAEVAAGSFYTYFKNKDEVFAALVEEVQEDMLHPRLRERLGEDDVFGLIDAANRDYLLAYRRNARLMALFEQVAQIDDQFRELRRKRGAAFVRRNAKFIRSLQESGRVDPELDPMIASYALSGMVGRMAYSVFNLNERIPFERLVTTLNRLWANALRLDLEPKAP